MLCPLILVKELSAWKAPRFPGLKAETLITAAAMLAEVELPTVSWTLGIIMCVVRLWLDGSPVFLLDFLQLSL